MVPPSTPGATLRSVATAARPYHHGNLRPALLAEAERALAAGTAQDLSLRELARRIGVSHAAPRRHFADKRALLDALAQDGFERLGGEMRDAIAGEAGPFEAKLTALARAYVHFATEHAALLELMYAGKHRPGAADGLHEAATRAFDAPYELIENAIRAGEIAGGDRDGIALTVWAALHGTAAMANAGLLADAPPLDTLVGGVVERLVLGLRPRGGAGGGA